MKEIEEINDKRDDEIWIKIKKLDDAREREVENLRKELSLVREELGALRRGQA